MDTPRLILDGSDILPAPYLSLSGEEIRKVLITKLRQDYLDLNVITYAEIPTEQAANLEHDWRVAAKRKYYRDGTYRVPLVTPYDVANLSYDYDLAEYVPAE